MTKRISGAGGGGKGAGGGANEQADTLRSTQQADVLDLLSEGEIEGLTNGLRSIYLDGVPLQNADGNFNFEGVQVSTTYGTQGQASIAGADGVQNEIAVSVAVLAATPIVRTITNPAIDTVRVTIAVQQLSEQDTKNGDLKGSSFTWALDVQSNGGGFVQQFTDTVQGKTMSRYTRAKRVTLSGAAPWDLRVRRVSADAATAAIVNAFQWATYTEIQSLRLRYPNSALSRVRVGAQQFARIPVRSYDLMGIRCRVPTNYDPITRAYSGVWDGTFKVAWTDNPAWIFHEMVRSTRFGLGRYIATGEGLKWELYPIGRYCDAMVPDGYGGMEPRFRCGLVLTTREQAYKVLTDLAAIFRGICYWVNSDVMATQDAPTEVAPLPFTPANVAGGLFTYSGASNSQRHSSVVVWFNNLAEQGKLVPEVVVDRALEARLGVRQLELSPLGVWSRGQAQRIGKWVLYTEANENETVTFRVGLDGSLVAPGRLFEVADPHEAGERLGGRLKSATTTQLTLDAPVTIAAGESYLVKAMVQDPADPARLHAEERAVTTPAGSTNVLTVAAAFSSAPAPASVWVLQSDQVAATKWRCLAVSEVKGENQFEITGLAHEPAKYALIEQGIAFERRPISRITLQPPAPTELLFTETPYSLGSRYRSRLTLSWREPERGLQYAVRWRFNDGQWIDLPRTAENSVDLDALPRGVVQASVLAINVLGNKSRCADGRLRGAGQDVPSRRTCRASRATVVQGGVKFTWNANQEDDYLVTTLRIGSAILFEGAASSFHWAWPLPGQLCGHSHALGHQPERIDDAGSGGGDGRRVDAAAVGHDERAADDVPGDREGRRQHTGAGRHRAHRWRYRRRDLRRVQKLGDGHASSARLASFSSPGSTTSMGNGEIGGYSAANLAADLNATSSDFIVVVWTSKSRAPTVLQEAWPTPCTEPARRVRCSARRNSRFARRTCW